MVDITARVTGHLALDRKLDRFTRRTQRRLIRNAQGKALTVVKKAAANEAPVRTQAAKRAVGKRFGKNKRKDVYEAKVGMGVGKRKTDAAKKKAKAGAHGHLIILGTVRRFTRTGADRGVMPSNDFVMRGFRRSAGQAKNAQIASIAKGIDKELAKSKT